MIRAKLIVVLIAFAFLSSLSLASSNRYWVGTCHPKSPFYATISEAVSQVPPYSIIQVCPGSYPEQVLINQPLTLQGMMSADGGAAMITAPSWGSDRFALDAFGFDAYYQILVQSPSGTVTISNMVVDGTGETLPSTDPRGYSVGIYFQNANGSISDSSIRNQTAGFQGIGIYADGSGAPPVMTIQNNTIRGQSYMGINLNGLNYSPQLYATIVGNSVDVPITLQPPYNLPANAIILDSISGIVKANTAMGGAGLGMFGSAATVTANTLMGPSPLWAGGDSSTFTNNTIACTGCAQNYLAVGLDSAFGSSSTKFTGNKVDAGGGIGIMIRGYGSAQVQSNTIMNADTAITGCLMGDGHGFTVTHNTIIDSNIGTKLPLDNTSTPNTFFATISPVAACTD